MAKEIWQKDPNTAVLFLSWKEPAYRGDFTGAETCAMTIGIIPYIFTRGIPTNVSPWIVPVAKVAGNHIKEYITSKGFKESEVEINFVGHSLGTYLSTEISKLLDTNDKLIALDPANSFGESTYSLDGNDNTINWQSINYIDYFKSKFKQSVAIFGSNSIAGNARLAETADQSFILNFANTDISTIDQHSEVINKTREQLRDENTIWTDFSTNVANQYYGIDILHWFKPLPNLKREVPGFDSKFLTNHNGVINLIDVEMARKYSMVDTQRIDNIEYVNNDNDLIMGTNSDNQIISYRALKQRASINTYLGNDFVMNTKNNLITSNSGGDDDTFLSIWTASNKLSTAQLEEDTDLIYGGDGNDNFRLDESFTDDSYSRVITIKDFGVSGSDTITLFNSSFYYSLKYLNPVTNINDGNVYIYAHDESGLYEPNYVLVAVIQGSGDSFKKLLSTVNPPLESDVFIYK